MTGEIRLATRGSALALAQTREVARRLHEAWPELSLHEEIIRTKGDQNLEADLATVGALDKGLFTKELEQALLEGRADVAVHSLKDLPTTLPEGLLLGAILPRAESADVLVSRQAGGLAAVPASTIVGTGSPRRRAMLRAARADLACAPIRGNVPTRLRKLAAGEYGAIIVAAAGLQRLGWASEGTLEIDGHSLQAAHLTGFLPAPGQGAIAVQIRQDDGRVAAGLHPLHDETTATCVRAERAVLAGLGGGCHMALGARGTMVDALLSLEAVLFDGEGSAQNHALLAGDPADPEGLGRALAAKLHGD